MSGAGPLQQLDPLLDRAPCGFLSFRDDGTIDLINGTLLDLLGYAREELVGRHVETILNVGTRIFYQTHLFPLARLHGRADEIFLALRTKAEEEVGVLANLQRREEAGLAYYDMVVMRVRERQKYEQELLRARRAAEEAQQLLQEQAAELEATSDELVAANEELQAQSEESQRLREQADAANRAKSDFLAVMSHELRTPLNAISGYLQIMEMGIQGPLTDAQRDTIERIDRAQRHLLRLINDILNLSKLEAGAIDYAIEDVDISEVVRSVEPLVEPQLRQRGLTLGIEVAPGLIARADRDKLEQIVLNLLSNAVKFTPEGGRIDVLGTHSTTGSQRVKVAVADTGIGIPEDKQEAIFEPFVQVDSDRSTRNVGTGLGLAISRDLARGMGGDLRLHSRVGEGSTFTILLPAGSAPATAATS